MTCLFSLSICPRLDFGFNVGSSRGVVHTRHAAWVHGDLMGFMLEEIVGQRR